MQPSRPIHVCRPTGLAGRSFVRFPWSVRRSCLPLLAALLFALCAAPVAAGEDAPKDQAGKANAAVPANRPNVVMLISDDQAWTDYRFMGHEAIRTPHLDKLASQSALFTRGYVPSSLCRPSLMTMATGLYAHQHKVVCNDPPPGKKRAELLKFVQAVPTLPRILGEHGYRSFQAGKWWEGNPSLGGFTQGMTHGVPSRGGRHGDEGLKIGRQGMQPVFDFIDECGDKPFFLWYAPMLPHTPHTPPQRILDRYMKEGRSPFVARYYAMCEWFDETCGQLLDYLDKKGLSENTLVVYVTDNGWIQNPEGRNFLPKSKRSPYDGGLRTPIMLRWPGRIKPMRDDATPVSSIDLAPTILAACGLEPTATMPGENLLPLCAGKPLERDRIFGEVFTHDGVEIDRPASGLLYRWVFDGRFKLILPQAAEEQPELYDVVADPHENQNLSKAQPDRVKELSAAIQAWWDAK